jgi:hypothetical protein
LLDNLITDSSNIASPNNASNMVNLSSDIEISNVPHLYFNENDAALDSNSIMSFLDNSVSHQLNHKDDVTMSFEMDEIIELWSFQEESGFSG